MKNDDNDESEEHSGGIHLTSSVKNTSLRREELRSKLKEGVSDLESLKFVRRLLSLWRV